MTGHQPQIPPPTGLDFEDFDWEQPKTWRALGKRFLTDRSEIQVSVSRFRFSSLETLSISSFSVQVHTKLTRLSSSLVSPLT